MKKQILLLVLLLALTCASGCSDAETALIYPTASPADTADEKQPAPDEIESSLKGWDQFTDRAGNLIDFSKDVSVFKLDYVYACFPKNPELVRLDEFETTGGISIENAFTYYCYVNYDPAIYGEEYGGIYNYQKNCGYSVNTNLISPVKGIVEYGRRGLFPADETGFAVYKFYPLYNEDGGNFPIIEKLALDAPMFYELEVSEGVTVKVQRTWFYLIDEPGFFMNEFNMFPYLPRTEAFDIPEITEITEITSVIDNPAGIYFDAEIYINSLNFELETQGGVVNEYSPQIGFAQVNRSESVEEAVIIKAFE